MRASRLAWPLLLLLAGCFEQPVNESLVLRFLDAGGVEVDLIVALERNPAGERAPAVEKRLDEIEGALLGGYDDWAPRFARLRGRSEAMAWEKREGRLVRLERRSELADPGRLAELFSDTPVAVGYEVMGGLATLAFYPGPADRASREQRRQMERLLDAWSIAVADYLRAAEALYRHLDLEPGRAEPCFTELFNAKEERPELAGGEADLVEGLVDAMDRVWSVLEVDDSVALSLDELSRLVYDPFPAPLGVEIPARAIEVEGFVADGERWRVPPLSLWSALEGLEGRWLGPDPLVALVEATRDDATVDPAAFAARPRHALPAPPAREVREAVAAALEPRPAYRITWRQSAVPRQP